MPKKLLNNPGGLVSQVLTVAEIPQEIHEKIATLEAQLAIEKAKAPLIQEKIVEVVRITDNPRTIEKLKKLEVAYEDLKAKGAYKLVKDNIPLIQDSKLKMEQPTNHDDSRGIVIVTVGVVSIVGFLFGVLTTWLIMR
jgi:sulfur transfer complex TusBCD TusB component (DsrH family)